MVHGDDFLPHCLDEKRRTQPTTFLNHGHFVPPDAMHDIPKLSFVKLRMYPLSAPLDSVG